MNIDDLLRIAMERRASDLHLKVGNYPHLRIDGELTPLTDQPRISAEDMLTMAFSMMSARQKQKFKESTEIDMAYGVAGLGRFRVNVFQQRGNVGLVLRVIPTKIRALDELYLPKIVEQVCDMPRGLILVTGVTGSGKSTTLAAMVDRINSTRAEHIITIEDPIEFLHRDKKGYVNQREIEVDTPTFSAALRASLRQDPDVILVGEMRDVETIGTALHAAETGHMVFLNPAHARCGRNHQPNHRGISSARAEADSLAACSCTARRDQPAPGSPLRRRRSRARCRSHDQYRVHPGMHPGAGKNARGSRCHLCRNFAVRHANLRSVFVGFVSGGPDQLRNRTGERLQRGRLQAAYAGHLFHQRHLQERYATNRLRWPLIYPPETLKGAPERALS